MRHLLQVLEVKFDALVYSYVSQNPSSSPVMPGAELGHDPQVPRVLVAVRRVQVVLRVPAARRRRQDALLRPLRPRLPHLLRRPRQSALRYDTLHY